MDKPLVTTFIAEVENLAKEYDFEIVTFGYNAKTIENGRVSHPLLNIKFKPVGKGNK